MKLHPVSILQTLISNRIYLKEVGAECDKGLPRKVSVTWDKVDEKGLGRYHSFTLKGHVEGTDIEAQATVTVGRLASCRGSQPHTS